MSKVNLETILIIGEAQFLNEMRNSGYIPKTPKEMGMQQAPNQDALSQNLNVEDFSSLFYVISGFAHNVSIY
jgi:hypothetical protein